MPVIPKEFTTEKSPIFVKPLNRATVESPCSPQAGRNLVFPALGLGIWDLGFGIWGGYHTYFKYFIIIFSKKSTSIDHNILTK